MTSPHLPVLMVVLPLMAAPFCAIMRRGLPAWALGFVMTWTSFILALTVMVHVLEHGTIVYSIGDWAAPWGIEYRIDRISALKRNLYKRRVQKEMKKR